MKTINLQLAIDFLKNNNLTEEDFYVITINRGSISYQGTYKPTLMKKLTKLKFEHSICGTNGYIEFFVEYEGWYITIVLTN